MCSIGCTRGTIAGRTEVTEVSGIGIYRVRNEPYRNVRYGIEAVPNLPEDFGSAFAEQIPPGRYALVRKHTFAVFEIVTEKSLKKPSSYRTPSLFQGQTTWD